MKLYILYAKESPYSYSDYPHNDDYWAIVKWIATDLEGLVKYVNRCRIKSVEYFRNNKPHRLDDNSDSIDFTWTGPSYHVLVTETDKEIEIDTRDAFEEWSEGRDDYSILTLEIFYKTNGLAMWHPDPLDVKQINESIGKKDEDIEAKLEEYKKLKEDLYDRGYLGRVDG